MRSSNRCPPWCSSTPMKRRRSVTTSAHNRPRCSGIDLRSSRTTRRCSSGSSIRTTWIASADAWVEAVRHSDSFFCDFRLFRRDGEVVSMREAAVLVRDVDGDPMHWQGLIQDLTDRKRAEDGLRASEARYRMLVEADPCRRLRDGPGRRARTLYVSPQEEACSATRARSGWTSRTSGPSCCTPTTARSSSPRTTSTTRPASRGPGSTG